MRTNHFAAFAAALLLASPAARAADLSTQQVMQEKLGHSQEILRGIATENYDLILANAQKLNRLSHATGWFTRQTPEYELFTNELRRHTDALGKAAKAKNLDAATLSYMQMTMSCVACHKYMRSAKVASLK
ncbi:MAG: hypothetical protein HY301_13295 [Verrucomicrobia bacterium]|nr:hypothetical protein [Verrucomicrobiota bacterium]